MVRVRSLIKQINTKLVPTRSTTLLDEKGPLTSALSAGTDKKSLAQAGCFQRASAHRREVLFDVGSISERT
jgi:hypothetical protein